MLRELQCLVRCVNVWASLNDISRWGWYLINIFCDCGLYFMLAVVFTFCDIEAMVQLSPHTLENGEVIYLITISAWWSNFSRRIWPCWSTSERFESLCILAFSCMITYFYQIIARRALKLWSRAGRKIEVKYAFALWLSFVNTQCIREVRVANVLLMLTR